MKIRITASLLEAGLTGSDEHKSLEQGMHNINMGTHPRRSLHPSNI
jgi:hypothetical protein